MGRTYEEIDGGITSFLHRQAIFFVATAPLEPDGHVNLSPKGVSGTFTVIDETTVAYLDLTGSGIETIAHLRENGRITLMFCSFDGPPRIIRLYGCGRAVVSGDSEFAALVERFPTTPGVRAIIVVAIDRIADSCGYGVPRMELVGDRQHLLDSYARKGGEPDLVNYRRTNNATSIDGLPGLPMA
jgi:hypothetical protein